MKKILIVCGNGLGSSFIVEMNAKKILNELGIKAEVAHTDLASAKTEKADFYIGSPAIVNNLVDGERKVIQLANLLDKEELRKVLEENLGGE
ncbi:PTS sugar transporter subunit IIB [Paramaledivibacter caminithermalis]|jgi:PTS system ascorbate-specific IIB component|uniref:PTS system IIB component, L-Asc family n=1 Tax=Paramaledivibacter caminithermalis (strain DSM 15212 / CIP 107654 / DViRD3) TaxID=1121301 RepID=A0A1M6LY49_PARC5|nr:PTS sugar transporter subunit IIB [Paramaledivibacter caminithermalis]SHJ76106.1 PTS system IIB component, L-Asc family [Paramaledivibacter caminithermalis DSM 15212]